MMPTLNPSTRLTFSQQENRCLVKSNLELPSPDPKASKHQDSAPTPSPFNFCLPCRVHQLVLCHLPRTHFSHPTSRTSIGTSSKSPSSLSPAATGRRDHQGHVEVALLVLSAIPCTATQRTSCGGTCDRFQVCQCQVHLARTVAAHLDCVDLAWENLRSLYRPTRHLVRKHVALHMSKSVEQADFRLLRCEVLHTRVTRMLHCGSPSRASKNRRHKSPLIPRFAVAVQNTLTSNNPAARKFSASTTSAMSSARGTVCLLQEHYHGKFPSTLRFASGYAPMHSSQSGILRADAARTVGEVDIALPEDKDGFDVAGCPCFGNQAAHLEKNKWVLCCSSAFLQHFSVARKMPLVGLQGHCHGPSSW